jgi:hypothetical protein
MLLKGEALAALLDEDPVKKEDPFVIAPMPDLAALRESGSSAIDLRLGTWITTPRQTRVAYLSVERRPGT